jgi:ditrans,polycis-polyprenyl diphosphate synthase
MEMVLRAGPCPKHVALIMDGNRRFARTKGMEVGEGHRSGYEALRRVLKWCKALDVQYVSVFAFSLDNFNREQHEVEAILDLALEQFRGVLQEG